MCVRMKEGRGGARRPKGEYYTCYEQEDREMAEESGYPWGLLKNSMELVGEGESGGG